MRQLVRFENRGEAETLGAALYVEGIENRIDESREGGFILWVHDEARLEEARGLLKLFEESPFDARFQQARKTADGLKRQEKKKEKKDRKRTQTVDLRQRWQRQRGIGPVTTVMIVISVAAFMMTWELAMNRADILQLFFFDTNSSTQTLIKGYFADIRSGQVWRLISPIFAHSTDATTGIIHILFNMWWLKDLGTAIERRQSSLFFVGLVVVLALVSNTAQYLVEGPFFVGMSGVVYGLFGYVWIRGRFDPASGYGMSGTNVALMLGFFVLCFTGMVGNIANTAHAAGLFLGAAWGYLGSGDLRRRFT
ncbi:MAG: rhomboid family intramembrane serine protease [Myxococcota bacterium]